MNDTNGRKARVTRLQERLSLQRTKRQTDSLLNDENFPKMVCANEENALGFFKASMRFYDQVMRCVEEETHAWMPADKEEVWSIFISQIIFAVVGKTRNARNIDAYAKSTLFSAVNTVWSKIQKRGEGQLPDQSVSQQENAESDGSDKAQLLSRPTVQERVLDRLLGMPDIPHTLVAACLGIDQTDVNDDMSPQASENVMREKIWVL